REAMQWFARYFGFRFPFPKYDLVLVPELAYGGMEHAGSTFLREDAVLFPSAPNETDILARAQLIFHEPSHQWLGDLVSMPEFYVGAPVFQRAVRQFVKKHAYAAADWSDLVAALERASGRDLKRWAQAWVKRRGMPEVRLSWDTDRAGRPKNAALEQHDVLGEGRAWPMKLRVFALPETGLPLSFD